MIIDNIEEYTRDELLEIAEEVGFTTFPDAKNPSKPTKAEIVKAINNAADNIEPTKEKVVTKKETLGQKRRRMKKELFKLKRVIITEQHKIQSYSEDDSNRLMYVTWGNSLIGIQTTRIVFGHPWMVPEGALKNLREVKATVSSLKNQRIVSHQVDAYKIEDIGLPTKQEIEEIAKRQKYRKEVL